jgi:hypothetical protein
LGSTEFAGDLAGVPEALMTGSNIAISSPARNISGSRSRGEPTECRPALLETT